MHCSGLQIWRLPLSSRHKQALTSTGVHQIGLPGPLPEREQILISAEYKKTAKKKRNSLLGVLEQAHMTQKLILITLTNSTVKSQWTQVNSLKSAIVGIFTTWRLVDTNKVCPLPLPPCPKLKVNYSSAPHWERAGNMLASPLLSWSWLGPPLCFITEEKALSGSISAMIKMTVMMINTSWVRPVTALHWTKCFLHIALISTQMTLWNRHCHFLHFICEDTEDQSELVSNLSCYTAGE